jgi:hypothetical protein
MKKAISILSVVSLIALSMPVMAQDSDPSTPPATPTDCKKLKGKERAACEKANKGKK